MIYNIEFTKRTEHKKLIFQKKYKFCDFTLFWLLGLSMPVGDPSIYNGRWYKAALVFACYYTCIIWCCCIFLLK